MQDEHFVCIARAANTETVAEILALIMCGMPRWSLNMVCPNTVPLNTLESQVKEEIKEVEAIGFVPYSKKDQIWATGVPVTYTALAQFNNVYVQNESHHEIVAKPAETKKSKGRGQKQKLEAERTRDGAKQGEAERPEEEEEEEEW